VRCCVSIRNGIIHRGTWPPVEHRWLPDGDLEEARYPRSRTSRALHAGRDRGTSPDAQGVRSHDAALRIWRTRALTDLAQPRVSFPPSRSEQLRSKRAARRATGRALSRPRQVQRASTTPWDTRAATSCSRRWPNGCEHACGNRHRVPACGDEFAIVQTAVTGPRRCH